MTLAAGTAYSPLVYIIILNWNGWQDTVACVESCESLSWPNYRVIIVDNDSSDGSEDILRRHFPELEIIQTGENLGFAGGNNAGIRRAFEHGADYVWLLNNDTVVDSLSLTTMVNAMEATPLAAIAGSMVYYHDTPRKIWFAGGNWEKGRLRLRHRGAYQLDDGQFDEPCELGSVTGCSMLIRASVLQKIGLLDESYFLYWEDTELCARAGVKNCKIIFVPSSHVWHKVSSTTQAGSELQYYYHTRNGLQFLWRYDPLRIPFFFFCLTLDVAMARVRGNRTMVRGYWQGIIDFYRGNMGRRIFSTSRRNIP